MGSNFLQNVFGPEGYVDEKNQDNSRGRKLMDTFARVTLNTIQNQSVQIKDRNTKIEESRLNNKNEKDIIRGY